METSPYTAEEISDLILNSKPIDFSRLTESNIQTPVDSTPAICLLAARGMLKDLPEKLLCHKILTTRCPLGNTIYHIAAAVPFFDQIPRELLTPEVMGLTNGVNTTVLCLVADELNQIPQTSITTAALLHPNHYGDTALGVIIEGGKIDQFDLTPELAEHYATIIKIAQRAIDCLKKSDKPEALRSIELKTRQWLAELAKCALTLPTKSPER